MCFKFKNDITWVLNGEFSSLNGEFLCLILLASFVRKKIICQTLRRKLVWYVKQRISFAFLTHLIRVSLYRYLERWWYVVSISWPDCHILLSIFQNKLTLWSKLETTNFIRILCWNVYIVLIIAKEHDLTSEKSFKIWQPFECIDVSCRKNTAITIRLLHALYAK